jgi:hypothetical protein
VVTQPTPNSAEISQRSIYDERYSAGLYDRRSAVPVLTAERDALRGMITRAVTAHPFTRRMSIFDFGYGTGRVVNDWLQGYASRQLALHDDLCVVAYDVSSVGLRTAADKLCADGFDPAGPVAWYPEASECYIAGAFRKREAALTVTVVFVHGCESQPPEVMRDIALAANGGEHYLLTTSWYSGLGHVPGDGLRREYFRQLSELTAARGEMVLCLSSTGDLVEVQPEWDERLKAGDTDGFPIEQPGDLVYRTELDQPNFCHVFGTELNDYMESVTGTGQCWWVEGIRYPGPEFDSQEAERANYRLVRQANQSKRGRGWNADDYREFHTVAAFRSTISPSSDDSVDGRLDQDAADFRRLS